MSGLRHRPMLRWIMPCCVGMVMFCNHYSRDSVGALEKQLETTLITPEQYATINAVYFFPNIITPIIAGMLMDRLGGASICYLVSIIIAFVGHLIFSIGAQMSNVSLLYLGRFLAGSMYEIVDALMPIVYLSPFFQEEWGKTLATMNVLLRMGSVVNFVVSPIAYQMYTVQFSLWISTLVSSFAIIFMLVSRNVEARWKALNASMSTIESFSACFEHIDDSETLLGEICTDSKTEFSISTEIILPSLTSEPNSTSIEHSKPSGLTMSFYFYLLAGSFMYGAMVPFWFFGSKFLQDRLQLSIFEADALMIIPEGMIIIVCFPMGAIIDRYKWGVKMKMIVMAVSTLLMSIAYIILVNAGVASATISSSVDIAHGEGTTTQPNFMTTHTVPHFLSQASLAAIISPVNEKSSVFELKDKNHLQTLDFYSMSTPSLTVVPIASVAVESALSNVISIPSTIGSAPAAMLAQAAGAAVSTTAVAVSAVVSAPAPLPHNEVSRTQPGIVLGENPSPPTVPDAHFKYQPVTQDEPTHTPSQYLSNEPTILTEGTTTMKPIRRIRASLVYAGLTVALLGVGYSCSTLLFWNAIGQVTSPDSLSFASGIVSAGVNVLPAIVPPLVTYLLGPENGTGTLISLAVLSGFASLCALLVVCTVGTVVVGESSDSSGDLGSDTGPGCGTGTDTDAHDCNISNSSSRAEIKSDESSSGDSMGDDDGGTYIVKVGALSRLDLVGNGTHKQAEYELVSRTETE